jgi:isocitrate lyase
LKIFREELFSMGYKFQFITLAGWHSLNLGMFELSKAYKQNGMLAYSELQQKEFSNEKHGFRSTKHQAFVGTGYFDAIQNTITQGQASTTAMKGSTEEEQFIS